MSSPCGLEVAAGCDFASSFEWFTLHRESRLQVVARHVTGTGVTADLPVRRQEICVADSAVTVHYGVQEQQECNGDVRPKLYPKAFFLSFDVKRLLKRAPTFLKFSEISQCVLHGSTCAFVRQLSFRS